MLFHRSCMVVLLSFAVAAASAQDSKDAEPPMAPEGWKYVASKDESCKFLVPNDIKRSSSRTQTSTRGGLKSAIASHVYTLKDDTVLKVGIIRQSGAALKGVKIKDVYDGFPETDKDEGGKPEEFKEFTSGKLKGKEYANTTKDGLFQRNVLFVLNGGRVYNLTVESKDKEKTTDAEADTFLKGLYLIPAKKIEPKKTESKPAPDKTP